MSAAAVAAAVAVGGSCYLDNPSFRDELIWVETTSVYVSHIVALHRIAKPLAIFAEYEAYYSRYEGRTFRYFHSLLVSASVAVVVAAAAVVGYIDTVFRTLVSNSYFVTGRASMPGTKLRRIQICEETRQSI